MVNFDYKILTNSGYDEPWATTLYDALKFLEFYIRYHFVYIGLVFMADFCCNKITDLGYDAPVLLSRV